MQAQKPEIVLYLPQPLWKFRINLVNMFHAEHCERVLLYRISKQRELYNVRGYPDPRHMHKYTAYLVPTLRHITVSQYI